MGRWQAGMGEQGGTTDEEGLRGAGQFPLRDPPLPALQRGEETVRGHGRAPQQYVLLLMLKGF